MSETRVLIVGNSEDFHVGAHLRDAAGELGIPVTLCDVRDAYAGSWLGQKIAWKLRGKRPARLGEFSAQVLAACGDFRPSHLLATGIAPLEAKTVRQLRSQGIRTVNFLTDDPWSVNQSAGWFMSALPHYECVFTPRHANIPDLQGAGCARVEFLAFAYNPRVHFRDAGTDTELASDVLFAGGADAERLPFVREPIRAGLEVRLYGGYWDRDAETRAAYHGHADLATLRRAVRQAKICLNLVRRANRDGNVMRTYEAPAMGGCLLTEDTPDHRALFGAEGERVLYLNTPRDVVSQAQRLAADDALRARLAGAAHERITRGGETYADRLRVMLQSE